MARLIVELTDRCNQRCAHCPSGRHGGRGDLSAALLGRVIAGARPGGIDQVAFTGGEPTLHPRFAELVTMAAGSGLGFGLVTNGLTLPDHLPTLLAHREGLRMITLSLDGARAATHETLRGPGAFRRVLQAASVCVLHGLPFTFNTTLTRHSRAEIGAIVSLAAGLGALGVRFGHLLSHPGTAAPGLALTAAERHALDAELHDLQAASDFPVGLAPGGDTGDLFPCAPLRGEEYNLDWRGRLGLCCHLSGFPGAEGAVAADLNRVGLAEGLAALARQRAAFRVAKRRHRAGGAWRDHDGQPCRYCARWFGALVRRNGAAPSHAADLLISVPARGGSN